MLFPITETMMKNCQFLAINAQILHGKLPYRADKDGIIPSEKDVRNRFWRAYNALQKEITEIQQKFLLAEKQAEIDKLKQELAIQQQQVPVPAPKRSRKSNKSDNLF